MKTSYAASSQNYWPLLFAVALTTTACEIDDSDRCGSGYDYDTEYKTCIETNDASTADTLSASDGEATNSPDATNEESGFGKVCFQSTECTEADVDYCAKQSEGAEGNCTKKDCTDELCANGWACCDCTAALGEKFCVIESNVSLVTNFASCTCGPIAGP